MPGHLEIDCQGIGEASHYIRNHGRIQVLTAAARSPICGVDYVRLMKLHDLQWKLGCMEMFSSCMMIPLCFRPFTLSGMSVFFFLSRSFLWVLHLHTRSLGFYGSPIELTRVVGTGLGHELKPRCSHPVRGDKPCNGTS